MAFKFRRRSHLGFLIGPIVLFLINKLPQCFLSNLKSISLSVQKKKRKIDFEDGCHGGHVGFLIAMILAIFDL